MTKWTTISCAKDVALEVPDSPGVYAVYKVDELVYIGQSTNLRYRLLQHRAAANGGKSRLTALDRIGVKGLWFKIRRCNPKNGQWFSLEYKLLQRLKPRLNRLSKVPNDWPLPKVKKLEPMEVEPTYTLPYGDLSDVVVDYRDWMNA